jgi:UDPglucose--hexose-1-phosphate uridylyltransferase
VRELRKDPVVGRWVIIATDRAQRPSATPRRSEPADQGLCPFCPGQEHLTPPEVLALGRHGPNTPWKVRVVPNRFPALMVEGELSREGQGIYDKMNGVGAHEVVIETPDHQRELCDLQPTEVKEILEAFKARIIDLKNDLRLRYVVIFKNRGEAAGASLRHSHSQLIALPVTPRYVLEEMEGARRHFELKERCIFCDIVRQERADGVRLIEENDDFVVVAPWAPKSPFETWILGKHHQSNFEAEPAERLARCAEMLRNALARIDGALDRPPYNFILHTNPMRDAPSQSYHWHIEIMPALTQVAGFEWGSGFYINAVPPEEAAEYLRNVRL